MEVYVVFQKLDGKDEKTLCTLFSKESLAKKWIQENKKFRQSGTYFYERWRVLDKEIF